MICLILIIMVDFIELFLACSGGGGAYYHQKKEQEPINTKINKSERKSSPWGGFNIPPALKEDWKAWVANFSQHEEKAEPNYSGPRSANLPRRSRGGGSKLGSIDLSNSWPKSWQTLGAGFEGYPPLDVPPHAYKAINAGLPSFCYLPPDNGNCPYDRENSTQWAYNPELDDCEPFQYSGCQGNYNRFTNKLACKAGCDLGKIETGCETTSEVKADFLKDFDGTDPYADANGRKGLCG